MIVTYNPKCFFRLQKDIKLILRPRASAENFSGGRGWQRKKRTKISKKYRKLAKTYSKKYRKIALSKGEPMKKKT